MFTTTCLFAIVHDEGLHPHLVFGKDTGAGSSHHVIQHH